jgi:hypothetical protein
MQAISSESLFSHKKKAAVRKMEMIKGAKQFAWGQPVEEPVVTPKMKRI